MGFLKKLGKAVGGVLKPLAKNALAQLPGAKAITAVVSTVKDISKSSSSSPNTGQQRSVTTQVSTKSGSGSGTGDGVITRLIKWVKEQWSKKSIMFWVVVLPLALLVVIAIIWLIFWLIRRIFKKKPYRTGFARSYTRSAKTPSVKTPSVKKSTGKRKASPAQLAALAKGRAKLKSKRR